MKGQPKWMQTAQWIIGKFRITIEVPYNWHKAHPNKTRGRIRRFRFSHLNVVTAGGK